MKAFVLWLAKLITMLVVIFVVIPLILVSLIAGVGVSLASKDSPKGDKNRVAVVELLGPIMDSKEVVEELYKNARDEKISGIVLRVNSPGGAVAPSQDIYTAVKALKAKKPIVASFGSVAASGGFYSGIAASKVFVQPGTQTGSIGVIVQIPNVAKVTEKLGVDFLTITSGELKDVGNPTRPVTEKDRTFLQGTVNKIYDQFLNDVASARGLDVSKVKPVADGRLILGSEAIELGLADKFGDINAAGREVFEILGKPLAEDEYPELIYKDDKYAKLRKIFDSLAELPVLLRGQNILTKPEFFFY